MRLSQVLQSGRRFGNLTKVRGIVYYSLSPFEQKAFALCLSKGLPNLWRRFREEVFVVAPPFVLGYCVYNWAENNHDYRQTKAGMIHYGEVELIKYDDDEEACDKK